MWCIGWQLSSPGLWKRKYKCSWANELQLSLCPRNQLHEDPELPEDTAVMQPQFLWSSVSLCLSHYVTWGWGWPSILPGKCAESWMVLTLIPLPPSHRPHAPWSMLMTRHVQHRHIFYATSTFCPFSINTRQGEKSRSIDPRQMFPYPGMPLTSVQLQHL